MEFSFPQPQIIVGLIAILVTLTVTAVVHWHWKIKRLEYDLLSDVRIMRKSLPSLSVNYLGQPVNHPRLIQLGIFNTGKESIASSDFEVPMTFSFTGSTKILYVDIIRTVPDELAIDFSLDESSITFKPALLNSSDSFVVQLLVDGADELIFKGGRILGIKRVERKREHISVGRSAIVPGILLFIVFCLYLELYEPNSPGYVRVAVAIVLLLVILVETLYRSFSMIDKVIKRAKDGNL